MLYLVRSLICLAALALAAGCSGYKKPEQDPCLLGAPVALERTSSSFSVSEEVEHSLMVPNGRGGPLMIPVASASRNPYSEEAYELKLRTRELAAQLLETRANDPLIGLVAMPVSFVNLEDFNESSPLGRYLAEAMFYEFNQRNFPTREYRLNKSILLREGNGEFVLSRALPPAPTNQGWAALLIGTYQRHPGGVFINARLIRPADGLVLRTAHMVLPMNTIVDGMTARPAPPPFPTGTLHITSR